MHRLATLIALALSALLLAIACGGDGSTPTPSPTPSPSVGQLSPTSEPTPTPEPAVETLAFIRDGDVWLINADGSDERRLNLSDVQSLSWVSSDELAVVTGAEPPDHLLVDLEGNVRELPFSAGGSWSPNGNRYLVPVDQQTILFNRDGTEVFRLQVGTSSSSGPVALSTVLGVPHGAIWSPDGGKIAYRDASDGSLVIFDLSTGMPANTFPKLRLLDWLSDESIVVASNYTPRNFDALYEARLLDLVSGQSVRVPVLDNSAVFWLSPNREKAVFTAGRAGRPEFGHAISILDFATGEVTPIEGAAISGGTHRIPSSFLAFSPNGTRIYFADDIRNQVTVYSAGIEGQDLVSLGMFPTNSVRFSPDVQHVAYPSPLIRDGIAEDGTLALWVADVDGSGVRELADWSSSGSNFAWQPLP